MKQKGAVGAGQLFCVLFVCRTASLFTFIITDDSRFPAGDRPLLFLPFTLLGLLCAVPAFLVMGPHGRGTLLSRAGRVSPALSKACAAVYAAGAIWSAGIGLARFEVFADTVLFPGEKTLALLGILAAAGAFLARRGLEVLARMGPPVLALTGVSLVLVCATVAKHFDAANLSPPLPDGPGTLALNGFRAAARTGEIASLLAAAPAVRGSVKKGTVLWLSAFGLSASAVYTLSLGVTGAYGERQMFQLYNLTVLARFGVIERPDAAICAVWVLCSLLRLAFHVYIAGLFLEEGFSFQAKTPLYVCLGAAALAAALPLGGNVAVFARVIASGVNEALFTALVIALPLAVTAAERIKQKKAPCRAGATAGADG